MVPPQPPLPRSYRMGGFTEAVYLEATRGMGAASFDLEGNSLSGLADKLSDAIDEAGRIGDYSRILCHTWHITV
jgi:hypothetical protein